MGLHFTDKETEVLCLAKGLAQGHIVNGQLSWHAA